MGLVSSSELLRLRFAELFMSVYLGCALNFPMRQPKKEPAAAAPWHFADQPGSRSSGQCAHCILRAREWESAFHSPKVRKGLVQALLPLWPAGRHRAAGRSCPGPGSGTQVSSTTTPCSPPKPDSSPRPWGAVGEEKRKVKQTGAAQGWGLCWAQALPTPAKQPPPRLL